MIAAERTVVVLLAAGLSRRFGVADKLSAPLGGLPLGIHAARTLGTIPFAARFAIVGADPPDYAAHGFAILPNDDPAAGQARSIAIGVGAAMSLGAQAVLIALADMPFVTAGHILALLERYDGANDILASSEGGLRCPPALFGDAHFSALQSMAGDRGARAMLERATTVEAHAGELADIDTARDLARHPCIANER